MRHFFVAPLITLSISLQAFSTPVINMGGADSYNLFVQAHPDYETFIESQLKSYDQQKNTFSLKKLLTDAQTSYTSGNFSQASKAYQNIADLRLKAHWNLDERTAISYAILRLIQLTHSSDDKKHWLNQLSIFQPHLKIDPKIFPPPFIAKVYQNISETPLTEIDLTRWKQNFEILLVNGVQTRLNQSSKLKLPKGVVLLSLLSNKNKTVDKLIHTDDLNSWDPRVRSMASGTCSNFSTIDTSMEVYFSDKCSKSTKISNLSIQSAPLNKKNYRTNAVRDLSVSTQPLATTTSTLTSDPWYKNSWIWVGVATVAAGIAYSQSQQTAEKTIQPTHR